MLVVGWESSALDTFYSDTAIGTGYSININGADMLTDATNAQIINASAEARRTATSKGLAYAMVQCWGRENAAGWYALAFAKSKAAAVRKVRAACDVAAYDDVKREDRGAGVVFSMRGA